MVARQCGCRTGFVNATEPKDVTVRKVEHRTTLVTIEPTCKVGRVRDARDIQLPQRVQEPPSRLFPPTHARSVAITAPSVCIKAAIRACAVWLPLHLAKQRWTACKICFAVVGSLLSVTIQAK